MESAQTKDWLLFEHGASLESQTELQGSGLRGWRWFMFAGAVATGEEDATGKGDMGKGISAAMELKTEDWELLIFQMFTGKLKVDPFTPKQRLAGCEFFEAWARERSFHPTPTAADIEQGPKIRLLQAFLRTCGGPNADALDTYATGIRQGYLQRMPRTRFPIQGKVAPRLRGAGRG